MMKRLFVPFFLLLSLVGFAQPQTGYVVQTVNQMKTYYGQANRVHVTDVGADFVICSPCTADEVSVFAGAGGRKWKRVSDDGKLNKNDSTAVTGFTSIGKFRKDSAFFRSLIAGLGTGGGTGSVTSISQGYGIVNSTNPITTTGTVRLDTATVFPLIRGWISDSATANTAKLSPDDFYGANTNADPIKIKGKQDSLISGFNIKTINGTPILGSGNISISGGSGGIDPAEVGAQISDSLNSNQLYFHEDDFYSAGTQTNPLRVLGKADSTSTVDTLIAHNTRINQKQDVLVSGTNIKTINGTSILGSGNISISGGGSGSELGFFVVDAATYGNGSTNATAHIQAQIDAAAALDNGGTVYLPKGTYLLNSALNYSSYRKVRIVGEGVMQTILKAGTAGMTMLHTNSNTTVNAFTPLYDGITGIQFDGDGIANTAMDLRYLGWFRFSNLYFQDFAADAVVTVGVLIGEWNSCTWDSTAGSAYTATVGSDAVHGVMQSNLVTFTNCNFYHCALSGSNYAVEWNSAASLQFRYCNFEYNGTAGNASTGSIYFNSPSPAGEGIGLIVEGCWWERGRGTLIRIENSGGSSRHFIGNTLMQFPLASGDVVYSVYLTGSNTNRVLIQNSKITHAGSTAELYATGAGARFEYQASEIRNYSVNATATLYEYQPTLIATGSAPDVTAPTLVSATVEDAAPNQIVLTYNESLNTSSVPATTDFSVSGGKTVTNVGVAGAVVTLTVNSAYIAGDVITVSYTAGTNPIEDLAGNNAANLSGQSVTNNIGGVANLLTAGSDFANAAWTKTNLTISSDAATDHNGLLTADKLTPSTTNAAHSLKQTISKASSAISYKLEGYVKADAYGRFTATVDQGGHGAYLSVNASTGGVTDQGVYGVGFALSAYSLTAAANGYYKFSMTFTTNTAASLDVFFYVTNPTTGANSFAGNGTDGVLLTNVTLVQQ